jgi:hypothetical protein
MFILILVKLGDWNKHDSSYYSEQSSKVYQRVKF